MGGYVAGDGFYDHSYHETISLSNDYWRDLHTRRMGCVFFGVVKVQDSMIFCMESMRIRKTTLSQDKKHVNYRAQT